jgi:adenine-specific DNA methylase
MKKFKFQDATFAYLGSKKRQCTTLASFIDPKKHETLISTFAGGCSFELFAKHKLGMKIVSNDWSFVSFVAQKALLENNGVKIEAQDIYSLFRENENDGFVKKNYAKYFTDQTCDFLDTATENIRQMADGTKKYLLSHLIVYYITHILPYGKMGAIYDIRNIKDKGLFDALQEASGSSESRGRKLIKASQHPLVVLNLLAEKVNVGIINNNKENSVYSEDVFSFLPKTQQFSGGTVLFADAPYFQSCSYSVYDSINEILLGHKIKKNNSVFNNKDVEEWFDKFFQASQHIDLWLLTYGGKIENPDALHSAKFLEMVKKHRPKAKLLKFENFSWSINTLSGKSPSLCEEYLIIAEL